MVVGLTIALVAGNVLVSRWSFDVLGGRARRRPPRWVVAWGLVLVVLVAASLTIPAPVRGVVIAAAVGSAAASFVPVLDARRTLLLNLALLVSAVPLALVADLPLLVVGAAVVSVTLWACWSGAWMLRVLQELQRAHEDRAALALATERLRISRDLHDVFGRTLAAIAVKSELAAELVRRGDAGRAAGELTAVRRLADEAGGEVRRVVRGEVRVTWEGEVAGARALLGAAGIGCVVTGDPVPAEFAEALARVVREGVTNILRHSVATRVTLTTRATDGEIRLMITNDGPTPEPATRSAPESAAESVGAGTGLRAMAERIGAIGGRVSAGRDGDLFLLEVVVPVPEGGRG
ncbi:sensor histidine kinase [Herbidospora cretacea]|uniref:sensor histidine kinase n=1 Tax=Herbidospora cretacea TaxID=28444 RepID=UPI000AE9CFC8|nr:histidine kinase [Herbidospora cretacea]